MCIGPEAHGQRSWRSFFSGRWTESMAGSKGACSGNSIRNLFLQPGHPPAVTPGLVVQMGSASCVPSDHSLAFSSGL